MKIVVVKTLCTLGVFSLLFPSWGSEAPSYSSLARGFVHPPDSARPWVFWFWLNGNISSNAITADLEAMKRAGIGGVAIMDVDQGAPKGPIDFGTESWFDLFKHMCAEAHRLGLQVNMNNDAGWSGSGGPWITPELSMQKLVWTETPLKGPSHFHGTLPQPQTTRGYYRDIAVLAVPESDAQTQMHDVAVKITTSPPLTNANTALLFDHNPNTFLAFPRPDAHSRQFVQLDFDQPFRARRLLMTLPGLSAHKMCHGQLESSADGITFSKLREFDAEAPAFSLNFEEVSARHYRILFTASEVYLERLDIAEVELSPLFRIPNIEEKALFVPKKESPPKAIEIPFVPAIAQSKIVNLSPQLGPGGEMDWDVPAGNWTLLRFGHTSTGEDNQPAPENGRGLECDKMNKEAAEAMFNGLIGRLVSKVGALAGKTFAAAHIDSWEVGAQNWTARFPQEFLQRRGYDLVKYLPIMTGRVVESVDISERFLWDLRQTVSDLIVDNYASHFRELAHRHGMRLTIEAYDLNPCEDLRYASKADEPMAEFWTWPAYAVAYSCIEMASAAHVYGKKIVGCEAFTATMAEKWLGHPYAVKLFGDWAYCHGINRFVLHRYALQPWITPPRLPGMSMGPWGLHYERTQTWWTQVGPWDQYLARCQFLLQQGLFVADICYLAPEEAPYRWQPPDRSKERPGYNYDGCPPEAVLTRMSVKDGRLVLPDGMSYRVLALAQTTNMTPKLLAKIGQLIEAGATVVGPPPARSPSLAGFPQCEVQLRELTTRIWGDCDGKTVLEHQLGKGKVVWGRTPQEELAASGVPPDFSAQTTEPDPAIRYTHRSLGGIELYFIANRTTHPLEAVCVFRVQDLNPEIWRPDTGEIERPAVYDQSEGTIRLPVHFDACGSAFVLFRPGRPLEENRIVSIKKDQQPLLECTIRPTAKPVVETNQDLAGSFTMMVWINPETEIDLPDEANAGSGGLQNYRNEALFPPPGQDVYPVPNQAGCGLSAGRNGIAVYEHSDNYFAAPLVVEASLTNWTHVAVVYESNRPSLFLNGRFVHQGLQSTFTVHCGVGVVHRRGIGPFWGRLSDFVTSDRALTVNEIREALKAMPIPKPIAEQSPVSVKRENHGKTIAEIREPGSYQALTKAGRLSSVRVTNLPSPFNLEGPWDVEFAPNMGAPPKAAFTQLVPWNDHPDPGIKFFSGRALYKKRFDVPPHFFSRGIRVYLNLGEVAVMARVILNGKQLGILWKPPFQVEVSDVIRKAKNDLEIEVVNLWPNRMIGDEQLPEDSVRTPKGTLEKWPDWLENGQPSPSGRYTFTSWRLWKKNSSLRRSGLIGPVRLTATREVRF